MFNDDRSFKLLALRKRRSDLLEALTMVDKAIDELTIIDETDHRFDGADPDDVPRVILKPLHAVL